MANRVLLGQDGSDYVLKVSKSGVNVLTASDEDLIFDSTKPEGSMILTSGTTTLTWTSIPTVSPWINFPQTYSFEPIVLVSRDLGSNSVRNAPEGEYASSSSGGKGAIYFRFTASLRVYTEVQTSRFRIFIDDTAGNNISARPGMGTSPQTFYYIVLNIGGATSS